MSKERRRCRRVEVIVEPPISSDRTGFRQLARENVDQPRTPRLRYPAPVSPTRFSATRIAKPGNRSCFLLDP